MRNNQGLRRRVERRPMSSRRAGHGALPPGRRHLAPPVCGSTFLTASPGTASEKPSELHGLWLPRKPRHAGRHPRRRARRHAEVVAGCAGCRRRLYPWPGFRPKDAAAAPPCRRAQARRGRSPCCRVALHPTSGSQDRKRPSQNATLFNPGHTCLIERLR